MRHIFTILTLAFSMSLFGQRINTLNDSLVMEEFGMTSLELYSNSENTKLLSYVAVGVGGIGLILATNQNSSEPQKQNGISLAGFGFSIGIALHFQSRYLKKKSGIKL